MKMISKYGIYLHLVEESDAEFILALRTNPKLNTYISHTSLDINDQIKWIQDYKNRENQGIEYYYVSKDMFGNKHGTIRLYDFDANSFELGSWIFMPNSPLGMAVKTHIIGLEIGYEMLKATHCRITVRKKNISVLRYLEDFKPDIVGEDELDFHLIILKENFYSRKKQLAFFS